MLRKFASMPIISAQSGKTGETTTLRRSASRAVFNYEPRDGYIYVRSRAISSRCNENFDEFPADEIKKGYKTFIGKPVFVNHHNDDHRRARGFIIDAALHEDTNPDGSPDTWAEVLMEVDAKRFPKLAKAVLAGEIDRTSMGVDVDHSICAACNNKATRPDEYCQHVPGQKGNRLYRHTASGRRVGILIREACYGLHFFENSLLVEDPADPTAFAWVDKPGRTASKTHTALPGTSSEDHDRGRHKGRDAAACEQCGSDIYLVQDGSPGGSWQHDIDSGAGIPHKARPVIGNVPFGREGMLAEAAKSKKLSDMTPAELAEESVSKHQAFLRHMAELSSTSRQSMWGGDDWAKPSGKAPYDPLHYTYGIGEKEEGHGPWHVTRHPETRDYQLVDNQNRLVQTSPSAGRSSYDLHPSNERSHAHQLWETVNVAHGHMDEPKDHEESFSKFYERPRPPFEHSPEDPKRAELNSRPEPRSYAPSGYEGPMSPGDHWNGPYEVVKHPETGKYHVMNGDGRHAGVLPRGGTDDHAHAQSRRDWIDGRMQSKERARGIADSIFNSSMDILDPGGTEESRRSDRNMRSMNALSHRYSDGLHHPLNPGHFGADDHEKDGDGEGDPYYEISDPGGSGWKARDYGGGQVRIHHAATGNEEHDMVDNSIHDHSTGNRVENPSYGHDELHQELHHWIHGDPNDGEDRHGYGEDYARHDPRVSRWQKRNRYQASKRVAFGEVKAPMSVDTLRQTKCPVCGSDNSAFASGVCRVCGFVQPPAFLQDPDLDLAKQVDLRQDEAVDPGDLSMDGEVIQPPQGEPQPGQLDPDQLDEEGNPIEGDEDGDEQVDPSQIGEDGEIQGGVPGMPADGTPDLVCPGCGFTSDARPPQTTSLSGEYTDPGDDGTMEGDVCPNCQQTQLMSPQDQKDMQGPAV